MGTLTMDEVEYVIPGYHNYKCIWSPEINEMLATVEELVVSNHTSRVQYLSKWKVPFKKYL